MRPLGRKMISCVLQHTSSEKLHNALMWPIARRVLGEKYSETVIIGDGIRMRVFTDMHDMVVKTLLFFSSKFNYAFEPATARLFTVLAKKASCVVAAGGHLGYYALIAAKHNPRASVHTFEPIQQMYDRLVANVKLNNFTNIQAIHGALSDKDGEIVIYSDDGQSSALVDKKKVLSQEKVKAYTLDSYFSNKVGTPDLMLLDVEGYESVVLAGATGVLASKPDMITEINPKMMKQSGVDEKQFMEGLQKMGYQAYYIPDDYSHTLRTVPASVEIQPYEYGNAAQSASSWRNIFVTTKTVGQLGELGIHVQGY